MCSSAVKMVEHNNSYTRMHVKTQTKHTWGLNYIGIVVIKQKYANYKRQEIVHCLNLSYRLTADMCGHVLNMYVCIYTAKKGSKDK